ncbi:MAG TPA: Tn3 family transposase [Pseudonocardiaceae bacterium]|nr:Tn3 family transposase [Pseudonocardiaceae bacterium]
MSLRKAIRRREIWVEGANIWRNPEDDLPADFEDNWDVHYQALSKPRDPREFIADLRGRHTAALGRLDAALKKRATGGVKITTRKGEPWISVPSIAKRPEPVTLTALKEEISRRWGVIDLLNLIKDADHVTHFTSQFTSVASRTVADPEVLRRRLFYCLFGLGTNMGVKRVADGAAATREATADTEAALRRTRRLFINRDNLRAAIRTLVNETLAVRDTTVARRGRRLPHHPVRPGTGRDPPRLPLHPDDTAARSSEVLALNVADLDLRNRRAKVRRKGNAIDVIVWQTATARLLPRLLTGRTTGPVFLTNRKARVPLATTDLDLATGRARLSYRRAEENLQPPHPAAGPPRPHQPPRHRGHQRMDTAPAPPLRPDPRRRNRRQHLHPAVLQRPHLHRLPRPLRPRLTRSPRPLASRTRPRPPPLTTQGEQTPTTQSHFGAGDTDPSTGPSHKLTTESYSCNRRWYRLRSSCM